MPLVRAGVEYIASPIEHIEKLKCVDKGVDFRGDVFITAVVFVAYFDQLVCVVRSADPALSNWMDGEGFANGIRDVTSLDATW